MNAVAARVVENPPHVVEQLVRDNRGLVPFLAKKFDSPLGLDELIAEGNVGLVIAAQRFDASRGVKFSTCAAWWIRAKIKSAIEREAGCGKQHASRKVFWNLGRAYRVVADEDGHASSAAIAEYLGVGEQIVEDLRLHVTQREVRLDASYSAEGELPIGDKLLVDGGPSPEDQLLDREQSTSAKAFIDRALSVLSKRDRYIVEQHDLTAKRTLQSIGDELGISRERVRQIHARSIKRMRRVMAAMARRQDTVPDWCDA